MNRDFSKPGFGWSNITSKASVTFIGDPILHENVGYNDFPGKIPIELLRSHTESAVDHISITTTLKSSLEKHLISIGEQADLNDFVSTGLSNGRKLQWVLMHIPPHIAFHLHAHPNIELITVLKGRIHEYRMKVWSLIVVLYILYNIIYRALHSPKTSLTTMDLIFQIYLALCLYISPLASLTFSLGHYLKGLKWKESL